MNRIDAALEATNHDQELAWELLRDLGELPTLTETLERDKATWAWIGKAPWQD